MTVGKRLEFCNGMRSNIRWRFLRLDTENSVESFLTTGEFALIRVRKIISLNEQRKFQAELSGKIEWIR